MNNNPNNSTDNNKPSQPEATAAPIPIIIKKVKKGHGIPHGGSWKIAYADFVTAMMAFFLLMWLLVAAKKETLQGIAEYFKMPLKLALSSGENVGDRSSVIKGGGKDLSRQEGQVKRGDVAAEQVVKDQKKKPIEAPAQLTNTELQEARLKLEREDQMRLSDLKNKLDKAIEANPTLKKYKNQLLIEITSKGLRLQILDEKNRPMFATGNTDLQPYVKDIIHEVGKVLNQVPNKISIAGHTDSAPYFGGEKSYSNWELSSERANAARRELLAAGMSEDKLLRVVGFSSAIPLDKSNDNNPINRRISIIVLNKKTEEDTLKEGF